MAYRDATAAAIVSIATALDGAVLGLGLGFVAAGYCVSYLTSTDALRRIHEAPSAHIADLRSLLPDDHGGRLVFVQGQVHPRSDVKTPKRHSDALISQGSGESAVLVQQTQTCLYQEWRGLLGWSFDYRKLFPNRWKEEMSNSLRSVPFVLVEGQGPHSGYVHVNLEGSTHPLPLTTVYHHLQPVEPTSDSIFHIIFGGGYPVAVLDEEKILPVGKEIAAIGICKIEKGTLEIKSCPELPYFLSDMTKNEIEAGLTLNNKFLFWSGIVFGAMSVGILGYSIMRNWKRWLDSRMKREQELRQQRADVEEEEEQGDIPDGELCVVCLTLRRRSAFVPCGHRVCCSKCANAVLLKSPPLCPVCRQSIRSSIRIYSS